MSATMQPQPGVPSSTPIPASTESAFPQESNGRLLLGILELGVLGDILLRAGDIGLNITLWCWALLVIGGLTARDIVLDRRRVVLLVLAAFFATVPSLRSDPMLVLLSGVSVLLCLVLLTWTAGEPETRLLGRTVGAYIAAAWASARHVVAGPVPIAFAEVRARGQLAPNNRERLGAVLRGILLAVPVLLVFGTLLVNADAAYAALVGRLFRWEADVVASHIVLTGLFGWLAAAYLSAPRRWVRATGSAETGVIRLGAIEAATVLALVDALFLSFVLVQARYLFGGAEHVLATAGLTFAEYARRGFFELVAVSALALPLLILLVSGTKIESDRQRRIQRMLVGVLIGLLLLMMASALRRMWLYQAEYGWTLARVHATALMVWIGASIIWFAATALRGRPERFTLGSIAAGLGMLACLAVVNPAAATVRVNAERVALGKDFDGLHAAQLGTDGLPALLAILPVVAPSLDEGERCAIRRTIQTAAEASTAGGRWDDWRVLSLSRMRARAALSRHGARASALLGGSGRCASPS